MNPEQAELIARLLQQYHAGFAFLIHALMPSNANRRISDVLAETNAGTPLGGIAFGFAALAIIYSYEQVSEPMGHPEVITEAIDLASLGITQNSQHNAETPRQSCYRHLRNCFAHVGFTVAVNGAVTMVTLTDVNNNGNITFQASTEAQNIITVAERLLLRAQDAAAQIAGA